MSLDAETLTGTQRETLGALGDVILPAVAGMPSASEADPAGKWLGRALRARPDLVPPLVRLLDGAKERDPGREVRRLLDEDPAGFGVLAVVVTGSYYMNVKVRKLIGYPGQKAAPPYPDEAEYYLDGGLLEPVAQRAPFYRAVD